MSRSFYFTLFEWGVALCAAAMFYVIPVGSTVLQDGLVSAKYFTLTSCMPLFAIAVTVWLGVRLRQSEGNYTCTLTDGFVLCGAVYYVLNAVFWGSGSEMKLIFAVSVLVWYAGLRVLFVSESVFRIMLLILLLVAGYEMALGIWQVCGGSRSNHFLYAATGTFFNPGPYGGFLAVFCPIALYQLLTQSIRAPFFWISLFLFLGAVVMLPVTMSRTAWAAAGIGMATVLVSLFWGRIRLFFNQHRALGYGLLAVGLIVGVAAVFGLYRMKQGSAHGRILLWKTTASIAVERPLEGCGFGRFAGTYGDHQARYFVEAKRPEWEVHVAGSPDYAFNEYLQIVAEGGVIGGILFAAVVILGLRGMWHHQRRADGLFFGSISLLVFAIASYPFSLAEFILVGVFMLAVGASAGVKRGVILNRYIVIAAWILFILPGSLWLWWREQPRRKAYQEWRLDHMLYGMKAYDKAAEGYALRYTYLCENPVFLFEYGHSLHFTGDFRRSNEILSKGAEQSCDPMFWNVMGNNFQALGDYSQAENCYLSAYHRVPNRLYPLYLLTRLYHQTGQLRKMKATGLLVLEFNEKVTSPATRDIKNEVRKWLDAEIPTE